MSKRTVRQILERLYQRQRDPLTPASAALEAQVMSSYNKRYGAQKKRLWLLKPQSMLARTAMAAVLLVAVLGVACEFPTSAEVEMGQRIVVQLQPSKATADMRSIEKQLHSALSDAGADKVRIVVDGSDAQHPIMDIVAWDEHLSAWDVENILRQQVGAENITTFNITALSGTVSETLGRRLLREFFGFDVKTETAEELRAGILRRLAEQGFDGATRVEVQDDGSTRKITVEASTEDGSREIVDEVIIKQDGNQP